MIGLPKNFPLGLNGLLAMDAPQTLEDRVREVQDDVMKVLDGRGELWLQAAYQWLHGRGHRIPTDMHNELRRLAKKETAKP